LKRAGVIAEISFKNGSKFFQLNLGSFLDSLGVLLILKDLIYEKNAKS
jgi:hypothetical protein